MNFFNNDLYIADLKHISQYIKPKSNARVLVTGASGLIGSLIVDALLYYNKINETQVFHIYAMARNKERLYKRFRYVIDDALNLILLSGDVCEPLPDDMQFDYIIHAASNADPGTYAVYPVETIKTNVLGTINVLEYAKNHINTRVLFTSTMEVYGEVSGEETYKEQDFGLINSNLIRSGYPESKRVSELLCRSYAEEYGVDAVITRLGYIYGPTMTESDNKAVAQFIRNALRGEDIVLKSKGEQRRSYCYGADTVSGIFCVLFSGLSGEVYNVANRNSVITIDGLANKLADIVNTKVVYTFPDDMERKGFSNPQDAVLAADKLEKLGWEALYDIGSGLKRTIDIMLYIRNSGEFESRVSCY